MTITAVLAGAKPDKEVDAWSVSGESVAGWSAVRHRARELSWVMAGKFALMGANAALMLFLAFRLDLETYGLLVITISGQLLISRVLMMGVDSGMIRLRGLDEMRARPQAVVIAGLLVIVGSSSVLIVAWLVAVPALSWVGIPYWITGSIVAGAIGTSLVDYGYGFRLGRREYPLSALAQGGTAIFRLGLTTLVAILFPTHTLLVFVGYHGASLLSGILQTIVLTRSGRPWPNRALIRRLLGYSRWIGKANIVVIFSLYQGTFLLTLLGQPAATGIFGLALTLSMAFFAIYNAYAEYLLARISTIDHISGLQRFMKHALAGSVLLCLGCAPIVLGTALLIPRFLRPELAEVAQVFSYLGASMFFLILQAPFEAACHYVLRPQLISFGWLIRAVFIAMAGIVLTPSMSAQGAAIAQLTGSALASVILVLVVISSIRTARARELSTDAGASATNSFSGSED